MGEVQPATRCSTYESIYGAQTVFLSDRSALTPEHEPLPELHGQRLVRLHASCNPRRCPARCPRLNHPKGDQHENSLHSSSALAASYDCMYSRWWRQDKPRPSSYRTGRRHPTDVRALLSGPHRRLNDLQPRRTSPSPTFYRMYSPIYAIFPSEQLASFLGVCSSSAFPTSGAGSQLYLVRIRPSASVPSP